MCYPSAIVTIFLTVLVTTLELAAAEISYFRCRSNGSLEGQTFVLGQCPADRVINITSAYVGYRDPCPQAPEVCKKSVVDRTHITKCNGQISCRISQIDLYYPQGNVSRLCAKYEDADFVNIAYACTQPLTRSASPTNIFTTMTDIHNRQLHPTDAHHSVALSVVERSMKTQASQSTQDRACISPGTVAAIAVVCFVFGWLIAFFMAIIYFKRKCHSDANVQNKVETRSDQTQQYYNIAGMQLSADAVTSSDNNYQSMQLDQPRDTDHVYKQLTTAARTRH